MNNKVSVHGIGIGNIVAAVVSWAQWKSVGWALVHGFFGWIYLILWFMGCVESAPLG